MHLSIFPLGKAWTIHLQAAEPTQTIARGADGAICIQRQMYSSSCISRSALLLLGLGKAEQLPAHNTLGMQWNDLEFSVGKSS